MKSLRRQIALVAGGAGRGIAMELGASRSYCLYHWSHYAK
ncbi:hypothetical protein SAMN04487943_10960 [Gracilibacillus orientalis]|uniref:Uncharacterized protein n=1 Tax=Gracilibacillus orientalis TaxID=334253 RepID=A0A1I4NNW9_9BACI|nr:hypothetical protein SAMN04487943_10960 [Gracilibacillus orientalis]